MAIYQNYLKQIIGSVAACLNITSAVVFVKIIRSSSSSPSKNTQTELFKYLLLKSMCDTYISVRTTFRNAIVCKNCDLEKIYAFKWITVIFFDYIQYAVNLLSTLITIASGFNMVRSIEKQLSFFNRIPLSLVVCLMAVSSFGFYIYKLFDFSINAKYAKNSTEFVYELKYGKLKEVSDTLDRGQSIFVDGVCQMVVIVLNVLTTIKVMSVLRRKKKLTLSKNLIGQPVVQQKQSAAAGKAQLRLVFMIMTTSTVAFVCSGINLVKFLNILPRSDCFINWSDLIYWAQYDFKFFVYYFFNLNFQIIIDRLFIRSMQFCGFKFHSN